MGMSREEFTRRYEDAMDQLLATGVYEDQFVVMTYRDGKSDVTYKDTPEDSTDRYKKHGPPS